MTNNFLTKLIIPDDMWYAFRLDYMVYLKGKLLPRHIYSAWTLHEILFGNT